MNTNEIVASLLREIHNFKTTHHKQEFNGANSLLTESADLIDRLQKELDAAVAKLDDLTDSGFCHSCTGCNAPHDPDKIRYCADWQWRGIESEGK